MLIPGKCSSRSTGKALFIKPFVIISSMLKLRFNLIFKTNSKLNDNNILFFQASSPEEVPPVVNAPHHTLLSILRGHFYLVAVCTTEAPPLLMFEFLQRVYEALQQYLAPTPGGDVTEHIIKENIVLVYEVHFLLCVICHKILTRIFTSSLPALVFRSSMKCWTTASRWRPK